MYWPFRIDRSRNNGGWLSRPAAPAWRPSCLADCDGQRRRIAVSRVGALGAAGNLSIGVKNLAICVAADYVLQLLDRVTDCPPHHGAVDVALLELLSAAYI